MQVLDYTAGITVRCCVSRLARERLGITPEDVDVAGDGDGDALGCQAVEIG